MHTDPEEDYARGWIPFLDCKIYLDSHPLIPRIETEYWVEQAIEQLTASSLQLSAFKILDLFAGSGAIGITVLKHLSQSRVDFGEIDAAHLPTIQKNIRENQINEQRTKIIQTDVWEHISGTYDFIFANPPYLSKNRQENIQTSVLAHEPTVALFAEEDGLLLIRKTIEGLSAHLNTGGALYMEHDPEQSEAIADLALKNGLRATTHTDQFGVMRYSVISVA